MKFILLFLSILFITSCSNNDDTLPQIEISLAEAEGTETEGENDDPSQTEIKIVFSKELDTDIEINYLLSGTATLNEDYHLSHSSPFTVLAGESEVVIKININDDAEIEEEESIILSLTGVEGGNTVLGNNVAFEFTILDNELFCGSCTDANYTLTADDYTAIGNTAVQSDDQDLVDAGDNLLRFGNFNLFLWTTDMLVEGISKRLYELFPAAEDGQIFIVSYDYYNGTVGTATFKFIKSGNGYILFN